MIKTFVKCIREYKAPAICTLLFMVFEVLIEVLIPFFTADLVNDIKAGAPMNEVVRVGVILVAMAVVSLLCGAGGGYMGSKASTGFARNVRRDVFERIQHFSFENIDKFSTASLVTRLTTDIGSVQMAFMMAIRLAVRAPLHHLCGRDPGADRGPAGDRKARHARLPGGLPQVRPDERIHRGERARHARGQELCPRGL